MIDDVTVSNKTLFLCDHCKNEISLNSLESLIFSYGFIFLSGMSGKNEGYIGCVCPNSRCSKTTIHKFNNDDFENIRAELFIKSELLKKAEFFKKAEFKREIEFYEYTDYFKNTDYSKKVEFFKKLKLLKKDNLFKKKGMLKTTVDIRDNTSLVYYSHPDMLLSHRRVNSIRSHVFEIDISTPTGRVTKNDFFSDFPNQVFLNRFSSYCPGDTATGPTLIAYLFKEKDIEDLVRIENKLRLKTIPRYIVHDDIFTSIEDYIREYMFIKRSVIEMHENTFWYKLKRSESTVKWNIRNNFDLLTILDTMQHPVLSDDTPRSLVYPPHMIGYRSMDVIKKTLQMTRDQAKREDLSDAVWKHFAKDHIQKLLSQMITRFISEYIHLSNSIYFCYDSVWNLKEQYLNQLYDSTISRHKRSKTYNILSKKQEEEIKAIEENFPAYQDIISHNYEFNEIKLGSCLGARSPIKNKEFLLLGETGTGKGLFAEAIHQASERDGELVKIECNSIPPNTFESELFGHVKGSFSDAHADKIGLFEIANGGTIFLDEIGDIPISLQNKLRSAIQDRKIRRVGGTKTINIDAIIISATNKKLKDEIQKGNFKDDLFYRINRNTFEIPPLRNRKEDILPLAKHFIKMSAKEFENPSLSSIDITTDGLEVMGKYDWPGNVRELENEIVRIMVVRLTNKDTSDITPYDLKKEILGSSDQTKHFKKILVGKGKRNLPEIEEVARLIDEEKLTPTEVGKIYGVRREHVSREYHKYKRLKNNHKNTS